MTHEPIGRCVIPFISRIIALTKKIPTDTAVGVGGKDYFLVLVSSKGCAKDGHECEIVHIMIYIMQLDDVSCNCSMS